MKKLAVLLLLTSCATISKGTTQQVYINSDPMDAKCTLERQGQYLGTTTAPGIINVEKSKYDMICRCKKTGYNDASAIIKSDVEDMTYGNLIVGGLIGWGIDSATGSDNYYRSVNIRLGKK